MRRLKGVPSNRLVNPDRPYCCREKSPAERSQFSLEWTVEAVAPSDGCTVASAPAHPTVQYALFAPITSQSAPTCRRAPVSFSTRCRLGSSKIPPAEVTLVVKGTLCATVFVSSRICWPKRCAYQYLRSIPGVEVLWSGADSRELMKNAQCVFSDDAGKLN